MRRVGNHLALCVATVVLGALGIVGCATGSATSTARTASTARAGTATGFVGYHWAVVTITHDGRQTSIPAGDLVYLDFARGGQFGSSDPINNQNGAYRPTSDGFVIVGPVGSSAVGYAGSNPVTILAIDAIGAFQPGVPATTTVSGNRLTVTVGGYRFNCLRDGTG